MAATPFSARGDNFFASLRAGTNVADSELREAIRDLKTALHSGQTVASALEGSPLHDVWAKALTQPDVSEDSKREHVVRLRHAALGDLDPLAADWSRVMRPAQKRGPFLTEADEPFWIDTFLLPRFVNIVVQRPFGQPRLLARIAIRGAPVIGSRIRLGKGTVWLASSSLASGRPVNEFVGMRITRGTAMFSGQAQVTDSTVTLSGGWQLDLQLTLEHAADAEPVEGPGADAAAAKVKLPPSLGLTVTQTGLTRLDLGSSSLSAYGNTIDLTPARAAPFYDKLTRALVVPCTPSAPEFAFGDVRSTLFGIRSSSAIARSGWALLVATSDPSQLGEADAAGFLWLDLTTPLPLIWRGLKQETRSKRLVLGAAPAAITLWAVLNPRDVAQRLALWDEPNTKPPRRSSIEVTSVAGSVAIHVSQPGTDAVLFGGALVAHLDRPLAADGGRIPVRMSIAWLGLTETATGTTASALATNPAALSAEHIAFALENAFVKVRPPVWLGALGPFENDALGSGLLFLNAPYRFLLPTLPDPYASNFDPVAQTDQDIAWISASVTWNTPPTPVLSFALPGADTTPLPSFRDAAQELDALPVAGTTRLNLLRVLLDVSSNVDQMGVVFPALGARYAQVSGLSLMTPASQAAVLTLPPISWEPMLTKPPEPNATDDIALPAPPHDGGPAMVTADTVELRPVHPLPLLMAYHDAISLKRHFAARLPLPFGLIAHLDTRHVPNVGPSSTFKGTVFLNRPRFDANLRGALQLAFRGEDSKGGRDPTMLGYVEPCSDNDYALGVLSKNILDRFDGDFGRSTANGVPLRRYELSGYGASLFSDWRDREAVGPAIIQARFDVSVGRTAYEVIQMQSTLYPYGARVVRTITIERKPGGWVLREDSGWVATSDGEFLFKEDAKAVPLGSAPAAFVDNDVHRGAVKSVVSIQNIRLDGGQRDLPAQGGPGKVTWQPVRFDADILFDNVSDPRLALGAGASGQRVPSRGLTGWIQIDGPPYKSKADDGQEVERARPANGAEVGNLLALLGPARGLISCEIFFGGTEAEPGLRVHASTMDVSCAIGIGPPRLVVTVRGSPALPRDGAWSLARLGASETEPHALDPSFPVPIVRPNSSAAGSNRWHLSDPADILLLDDGATPSMRYGLVQSLGTQKVFFSRPRAGSDAKPITVPKPPQLADVGSLLNAAGIFPSLGESFDFKNLNALAVTKGDLGFSETFEIGALGSLKSAVLADLGGSDAIQLVIEYHDEKDKPTVATISVNPTSSPRWSITLERVAFTVRYRKNPLISLFARMRADEHTAPTIQSLNVRYESTLQCLQSIFTNVQQMANFLPGGAGASLKVGFSHGHLTIRNEFALPNLPLGAGQINDIAVIMALEVALTPFDVRFVAGLGSSERPFRWIVSPLAGTGVVQVGIGRKGLDVLVQGGLGLGLAIDLGISSGAANITLALEINTGPDPFEIKGILSGRASVDVLRGLASATITLAAGLGIIPPKELFKPPYLPPKVPPENPIGPFTIGLTASVSVGIHITVCWVIDVDFDAYWQFRQDIETPAIPIPLL